MKRHYLLAAWLMFFSYTGAFPQTNSGFRYSPAARAKKATEWMNKDLALSDSQRVVVEKINLKFARLNQSVAEGSGSRYAKQQQLKSNVLLKKAELKAILTPTQFRDYKSLKEKKQKDLRQ